MRDRGNGLRTVFEGVNLLGFGGKAGQGSEADPNQPRRSVTAKVGKPGGNAPNRACDDSSLEASKRSR